MPDADFLRTRTALHAVAELLAGAQHHASGSIRLRVTPNGFATVSLPDLRVVGTDVLADDLLHPIVGTLRELMETIGVVASRPEGLYRGGSGVGLDDALDVDIEGALRIANALAVGAEALHQFAPDETPVLWPEHFDVGIRVDDINYGVSPGDGYLDEPYAYVGVDPVPQSDFWNAPFGAARPLTGLTGAPGVAGFFVAGRDAARAA